MGTFSCVMFLDIAWGRFPCIIGKNIYGFDSITFRFERANDCGFDFAEGKLPENQIYKSYGFSEDDLLQMQEYLKNNSFLIWEIAGERGEKQSA